MESQDIGNHHIGAVAKAALGSLLTETQMLERAGEAQIEAGTSQPEWQIKVQVLETVPSDGLGPASYQKVQKLLPPYGGNSGQSVPPFRRKVYHLKRAYKGVQI